MMNIFSQILRWLPTTTDASTSSTHFGVASTFKVQVNFDILVFEVQIDVHALEEWENLLEGYFLVYHFSDRENITFALLKVVPHVKDWWDTYNEQTSTEEFEMFGTKPTRASFMNAFKGQYYPVGIYEDQYTRWTTLQQKRDQAVSEFTNTFHTLPRKLGIRNFKQHMVLKYRGHLHKYIQTEIEFLDISSLGVAYRYTFKLEQKFKQKNRRDFRFVNASQKKEGKGNPNTQTKGPRKHNQPLDNPSKSQTKKGNGKTKKETGKWCDFYKSPWHNKDECHTNQSLVVDLKSSQLDPDSDYESEMDNGKQIIEEEPIATTATTQIHPEDPKNLEEREHLFHSQIWVNGVLLLLIVDNGSQKNLISTDIIKQLKFPTTPHPQAYNIGWLSQGRDLCVSQQCHLLYVIKSFKDEVLCDIAPLEVSNVLLSQPYMWKRHDVYES